MAKKELLEKNLSVRLTLSSYNKLEIIARNRGMTPATLARFWLEEKLKKKKGEEE